MNAAIQTISLKRIDGNEASLADYAGSVVMVVNVASKCGLTPQYEGLESIYGKYRDQGFVILGFPANNFAGQEPGTNAEIAEFCRATYGVDFPMFQKISVSGDDCHPLYRALIAAKPVATRNPEGKLIETLRSHDLAPQNEQDIMWNFEKFLLDRDGHVVERFAPDIAPDDATITSAIERELNRSS